MKLPDLCRLLAEGGVIACPTETLVGLLADATHPAAVDRVAQIKGREADAPIAVLLPDATSARFFTDSLGDVGARLADAHWPGPLTIVARARPGIAVRLVRDGKVGMRVPSESAASTLARAYGRPLTATSANLSGGPSVSDTRDLAKEIRERVDHVVEGVSPGGAPSTVLDVTVDPPRVLREGAIVIDSLA